MGSHLMSLSEHPLKDSIGLSAAEKGRTGQKISAEEIVAACSLLLDAERTPRLDEVRRLVRAYLALPYIQIDGLLHEVIEDGVTRDEYVDYCVEAAERYDDRAGHALGKVIRRLTRVERDVLVGNVVAHPSYRSKGYCPVCAIYFYTDSVCKKCVQTSCEGCGTSPADDSPCWRCRGEMRGNTCSPPRQEVPPPYERGWVWRCVP